MEFEVNIGVCVSGLLLLFLEQDLNPARLILPLFLNKAGSWLLRKAQHLMTLYGSSRLVTTLLAHKFLGVLVFSYVLTFM